MSNSIVGMKSFDFAVRIVKLHKYLSEAKKERVMSKQLLRSGTSIGANITEALNGQSRKDYSYKMHLALKEANETLYWIDLLGASGILTPKQTDSISSDCKEIIAMLVAIIKTTRQGSD